MIKSMTGYGKREAAWKGGRVSVELRSVNHRFCEIVTRVPRGLVQQEEALKRMIQRSCLRGRIDVAVVLTGGTEGARLVRLDRALATQYHRALHDLKRALHLSGDVDLALLAGFREVLTTVEGETADPRLPRLLSRLTTGALGDLDRMRRREGASLEKDIRSRLKDIGTIRQQIQVRAPDVVRGHFERLKNRVETLLGAGTVDHARLYTELATQAERCDITEELTRLASHERQFDTAMKAAGAVGKTLDFILQEMGREVNTIGSKGNDAEITAHVVKLKGELEKIREQVQNVE